MNQTGQTRAKLVYSYLKFSYREPYLGSIFFKLASLLVMIIMTASKPSTSITKNA